MTNYSNYINGLYIVLYGRTADSGGYNYWLNTQGVSPAAAAVTPISAASEQALSKAFVSTQSSYFDATYGLTSSSGAALSDTNFILALYNNLGGNTTGVSGAALTYWQNALNAVSGDRAALAGRFTEEFLSYNGTDAAGLLRQAAFFNSVAVSQAWVSASASNSFMDAASTTDPAFLAQQKILTGISSDPATLATALGQITTAVSTQSLTGVVGNTGAAFALTTGQDNVGSAYSHVAITGFLDGTLPPAPNQTTVQLSDIINPAGTGNSFKVTTINGFTGLNVGTLPTLTNIQELDVTNNNLAGAVTANLTGGVGPALTTLGVVGGVGRNVTFSGFNGATTNTFNVTNAPTVAAGVTDTFTPNAGLTASGKATGAATLNLAGDAAGATGTLNAAINLSGASATDGFATVTVNSNGTVANDILSLTDTALATLNIAGTAALKIDSAVVFAGGGAGVVNIQAGSDVGGFTLDVTGNTGKVVAVGGSGANSLAINETSLVAVGTALDGGTGTSNELIINGFANSAADYTALTKSSSVKDFQILGIEGGGAYTVNAGTGGLANAFSHFQVLDGSAVTFTNLANNTVVDLLGGSASTFGKAVGASTLTLNVINNTGAALASDPEVVTGWSTVNLSSNGSDVTLLNTVGFTNSDSTAFVITGSENLTLNVSAAATTGSHFDASAFTGSFTFTDTGKGDVILTGSGTTQITSFGGAPDTITLLSGHTKVATLTSTTNASPSTYDHVTNFVLNQDVLKSLGGPLVQGVAGDLTGVITGTGLVSAGTYATATAFITAAEATTTATNHHAVAYTDGSNTYVAEWNATGLANSAHIVELVGVTSASAITLAAGAGHILIG